jgi:NADH:ubiquinone oxidoreductase subunit E
MTRERQRQAARFLAAAGALAVVASVLVLTVDYVRARRAETRDAQRIVELQAAAQLDASAALTLRREQDAITEARRARKARADALAIVLLSAAVMFVAGAKWQAALGSRRPGSAVPLPLISTPTFSQPREPLAQTRSPGGGGQGCNALPTLDVAIVDAIVAREGTNTEAAIPILQAIQAHYRYLPDAALQRVCELTDVTPTQIAGTSTFYARFRRSPVGEHVVRVCHGTACHVSGARQITDELRRRLGIADGADTDPRGLFTIDEVACVGCCSLAPVLMIDEHTVGRLTPATACAALEDVAAFDREQRKEPA